MYKSLSKTQNSSTHHLSVKWDLKPLAQKEGANLSCKHLQKFIRAKKGHTNQFEEL